MYLSLENCRQLKKFGCDVDSRYSWEQNIAGCHNFDSNVIHKDGGFVLIKNEHKHLKEDANTPAYNLRDIICSGELSKVFFGDEEIERWSGGNCGYEDCTVAEYSYIVHTDCIKNLLQQNKLKEAEDYFMDNTVFNPKNK